MRKLIASIALVAFITSQSLFACTIFAAGKDVSVDGSTIIAYTCDSTSLQCGLQLHAIPSMPAGEGRDIVTNSRGLYYDYSAFPEVKDYGQGSQVNGTFVPGHDTYRYIHAAVSFINEKGLALGECTDSYDRSSEQGRKLTELYKRDGGIIDYFILTDLTLENCSKAREAVEFMGHLVDEYGWTDAAESICVTDGEETWIFEPYGAHVWAAVRVPDNAVFVAGNRARINFLDLEDTDNYLASGNIVTYALENGLWDGEGEFRPCEIYAPNPTRTYSTRREWVGLTMVDPSLDIDPEETDPSAAWPLFAVPGRKLTVEDFRTFISNYYQGTDYDTTKTLEAGPYGNPLSPRHVERAINCYRTTFYHIATINKDLPEEVRGLTYFGWGAPDSSYMTPIFGAQTSLPAFFGKGDRLTFDKDSGWWNVSLVQQLATINYQDAIRRIHDVRDGELESQYRTAPLVQKAAASLIEEGERDAAIEMLTLYSSQRAQFWFDTWESLADELTATYMLGTKSMRTASPTAWWQENVTDLGLK